MSGPIRRDRVKELKASQARASRPGKATVKTRLPKTVAVHGDPEHPPCAFALNAGWNQRKPSARLFGWEPVRIGPRACRLSSSGEHL